MKSKAVFVDPERDREFRARGFTVVPLLTPEEVAEAWAALSAIIQTNAAGSARDDLRRYHEPDRKRDGDPDGFHVSYYSPDSSYQREVMALVQGIFAERIDRIVSGYRVSSGGAFVKEPGGGEMAVHRDYVVTPDPDEVTFTVWCALADADESNGALHMLAGSHRVRDQINGPGVEPFFSTYPDRIKRRSVGVPAKAGEAVVFRTGVIHWSPPNRSERARPALHFVGVPEGARNVIYTPAPGGFDIRDLTGGEIFDPAHPPPAIGFLEHENRPLPWKELERLLDSREQGWLARAWRRLGGS